MNDDFRPENRNPQDQGADAFPQTPDQGGDTAGTPSAHGQAEQTEMQNQDPAVHNGQNHSGPVPPQGAQYNPRPPYNHQSQYGQQPPFGPIPNYPPNYAAPPYPRPDFMPYTNPGLHPKRSSGFAAMWLGIVSLVMPVLALFCFIILMALGGNSDENTMLSFGICSLIFLIGAVLGAAAMILGISANKRGRLSTATAGLVTGIIGCIICLLASLTCSCTCMFSVSSYEEYDSSYYQFYNDYSAGYDIYF